MLSDASQRRFQKHSKTGKPMVLAETHPAVVDGRSLFTKSANAARGSGRVLISGHNQRKLGRRVAKGRWLGFEIYTLTLEERKTCPRSCTEWRSCYGNRMQWSIRHPAGDELESKIAAELVELQAKHPNGFVVRLHILGDFYSAEYVRKWGVWLDQFPALHVFGYTARQGDDIAAALVELISTRWDRFAIRSSGAVLEKIPASVVIYTKEQATHEIVCPVQLDKTNCCATCALCWSTPKAIAFLRH
jgi:hypothetical protein